MEKEGKGGFIKTPFDDFANNYTETLNNQLNFFDGDNAYFAEYKVKKLKSLLTFAPQSILDFGCGVGRSIQFLKKYFPQALLHGCDVSQKSLLKAKENFPQAKFFLTQDLQSQFKQFDLIFVSNVFHHIPVGQRLEVMNTIAAAGNQGAFICIFEHNPWNPLTRYLVNTCPFDEDAVLLRPNELKTLFQRSGINNILMEYTLFFPAFLKRLRFLENYLTWLPLGGQYLVCGRL